MSATARINIGWTPFSDHNPIPGLLRRPLAAAAQVGKGQFVTVDSSGNAALNDGTVPNGVSLGNGDIAELSDTNATAALAACRASSRFCSGLPSSTVTNDGFTDADYCVPFWIKDENTPGKLSNYSGSNRSLGGLVFGLDLENNNTPVLWPGPIAWAIARSQLVANAVILRYTIADGATAASTLAETTVGVTGVHGKVTAIRFTGAAVTASDSVYATLTVAKRDGAGGGATTIGTLVTNVATGSVVAFTPKAFTLSLTATDLNVLEGDVLTITEAKASTGTALNGVVSITIKAG